MNKIKAYHPALMKSNYACFGFQNTFIRWIIIFTMLLSIPEMSWGQQQQEKIDSLKTLLEKTNIDTKKIPLFLQLASCYDTLEQNIAFSYADSAFNCAESSNDNILITNTSNEAGIIFLQSGEFAEALKYFFISLEYSNKTDDPKTNASILSNIANVYLNLGQAPEAIQYWEQSLLVNEQNIITDSIPNCIIKLSDCYQKMGQETKSIEYLIKLYKIYESKSQKTEMAEILVKIADLFINLATETPLNQNIKRKNLFNEAQLKYEQALKIRNEECDSSGIAEVLFHIGEIWYHNKDYNKALDYLLQSEKISAGLNVSDLQLIRLKRIAEIQYQLGNYKVSFQYRQQFFELHDSIFNQKVNEDLALLQKKFDSEKQKHLISLYQNQSTINQSIIDRNYILLISFIVIAIISILMGVILRIAGKQKEKANTLLAQSNHEIEMQTEEIEAQKDHLTQLNIIVKKQTEEILTQKDAIEDKNLILEKVYSDISIRNQILEEDLLLARSLQNEILPQDNILNQFFGSHMLIFLSKDQLSGDFYWVANKGKYKYIAVADCTGHGIPGAFLTNIGIHALQSALFSYQIEEPGKILTKLHELIVQSFQSHKDTSSFSINEGMDIALLRWSPSTRELVFSGARRPLIWIDESGIHEEKGKKRSIGAFSKNQDSNFPETIIDYEVNSRFYLFSDGATDQLNKHGKKFSSDVLKKLFLEHHQKSFQEQKNIILEKYNEFREQEPQTDDICILGFKLPEF